MKSLRKLTLQLFAGANIATVVVMLLVGYSDRISPADHPIVAAVGLTFPILLTINTLFAAFWVAFSLRHVVIPVVGFIVCYAPIRTYLPLNLNGDVPADAIKVMSYNVWAFKNWDAGSPSCEVLDYIIEQDADIVCLQESGVRGSLRTRLDELMGRTYAYRDTVKPADSSDEIALFSKFPIVGKQAINYTSRHNHSAAFKLNVRGDTVIFIANHFESIGLSAHTKSNFKLMMKGQMDRGAAKAESKKLVHRLSDASSVRAPQADAVAQYIRDNKGRNIILCGDFNDSPISYVRRVIANELTDCYVACGNGPGFSYHDSGIYVRIDNIMCSDHWKPRRCLVDSRIKGSDHYPIICWLENRRSNDK